jgi:hypothetical protein
MTSAAGSRVFGDRCGFRVSISSDVADARRPVWLYVEFETAAQAVAFVDERSW